MDVSVDWSGSGRWGLSCEVGPVTYIDRDTGLPDDVARAWGYPLRATSVRVTHYCPCLDCSGHQIGHEKLRPEEQFWFPRRYPAHHYATPELLPDGGRITRTPL